MRFANKIQPTEAELRAWAAELGVPQPVQDWDLVLAWEMDPGRLRVFVELAANPALPNGHFFLAALYTWVRYAARRDDFDSWRQLYDCWLDQAKGVRDPAVKQWRRRARLVFQGIEPFDAQAWDVALTSDLAGEPAMEPPPAKEVSD